MHNLELKLTDNEWVMLWNATPGGSSMEIFAKEAIFEKIAAQSGVQRTADGLCPHGVSIKIGDCPKCNPPQFSRR